MTDANSDTSNSGPSREGTLTQLTPQRWQRIKQLLLAAEEVDPGKRDQFLRQECGSDDALRAEIESLLEADAAVDSSFSDNKLLGMTVASAPLTDPMIGRRVGAYEIVRPIGQGGMAVVYLAVRADDAYRKEVAVKLVRSGVDNAEVLIRFRNERQTLASLDHPNVVRLIDGGMTAEGVPYLVMDHVEGVPIDEHCDTHQLSTEQRLRLFCTVCGAVQYAHEKLVVHRDLKPSNILVTADGVPKLLDFGISKVLIPDASLSSSFLTQTGTRRMTPAYASPEQVRGKAATPASDIYSLGVVLYELLTGHRPYKLTEHTREELEQAICGQEPESPSTAVDRVETETSSDGTTVSKTPELVSLPREGEPERLRRRLRGDLDKIVLMSLLKEPQTRYRSVSEFSEDIQRHLDHLPIKARPRTLAYRMSKFAQRRKTELMATGLLLSVVSTAAFVVWEERRAAERAQAQLTTQQVKGRPSIAVLGFKNSSGLAETEWLSTALSEMLTAELSVGGAIRMIPAENVAEAKIDPSTWEAGNVSREQLQHVYQALGSDYVVFGSYQDVGGSSRNIRIDLRLQNVLGGSVPSLVIEGGADTDLFEVVEKLGAQLRQKMGLSLASPAELAMARSALPSNPDAARYYAGGLAKLRRLEALAARADLEKAISLDPDFALAHSALSDAWSTLGFDENAKQEAQRAFDLSGSLSRERRLWIEAHYRETMHEWDRASQIYSALLEFFPDNVDYGLRVATAQTKAGQMKEAQATIDRLRALPSPLRDDPRIDLKDVKASSGSRGKESLLRAIAKLHASGDGVLLARALILRSDGERNEGDSAAALADLKQARDLFQAAGDKNGMALVMSSIAGVYWMHGDRTESQKAAEASISLYRETGDKEGIARGLSVLALALMDQGDLASAEKNLTEALAICREIRFKLGELNVLNNLSDVLADEGELEKARGMEEEVLAMYRQANDPGGVAMASDNIAEVLFWEGDLPGAERLCRRGLKASDPRSYTVFDAGLFATLGEIQLVEGKLKDAKHSIERSKAIDKKLVLAKEEASNQLLLARLALEEEHPVDAEQLARQAEQTFGTVKAPHLVKYANARLAQSLAQQGKIEQARKVLSGVLPLPEKSMGPDVRLPLTLAAAGTLVLTGGESQPADLNQAKQLAAAVLTYSNKRGYVGYSYEARLRLAQIEMASCNSDAAEQLATLEQEAHAKGYGLIALSAARSIQNGPAVGCH
jgi:serine/threonine protein kinase/tetratricopeptide (TPR) repeat protein